VQQKPFQSLVQKVSGNTRIIMIFDLISARLSKISNSSWLKQGWFLALGLRLWAKVEKVDPPGAVYKEHSLSAGVLFVFMIINHNSFN